MGNWQYQVSLVSEEISTARNALGSLLLCNLCTRNQMRNHSCLM